MAKFDSKTFNPQAFGKYMKTIKNVNANALAKSNALTRNEQAEMALSSQTGSAYCTVPYFGRISAATSQNNNGATNIDASTTSTYEQGFVVASRMDGFVERNFSTNITAGVNFMDNVAAQLSDYKLEEKQLIMLAILKGIFSMSTSGSTAKAKAAKAFVENHTFDVTERGDGYIGASDLNKAIQQAGGDNKNAFTLVCMHSVVATDLENMQLLEYMKYTDSEGIQRNLALATWNGRTVLVDDNMPVEAVEATETEEAYNKYTTYILGAGSIVVEDIGDAVPYEMSRDAKTNGGQDTLYVRSRYVCGVDGLSYVKPSTVSASNSDLANGANWEVIGNGSEYINHKAIPVCRIISKG